MTSVRLAALLVSGGLCVATPALAQSPVSSEAAAPVATPPPPPAPADAPTPPPAPVPAAAPDDENIFRFYGTFNPRIIAATGAVESYSQPNASAITAAGNPVFSTSFNEARYSFQVAQSRLGFWLNEKGQVRAQLEIDFVDFAKATPTVASMPRVRIARVDYAFDPSHTLSLGQDWDLHAPLNPHGINLVGALFVGGNSAFMRQQLKYLYSTPSLELGAALGFPSPNNTAKDASFELGFVPTLAVRGAYKSGKSRVGVSAIASRLPFNLGTPDEKFRTAYAAALYSELAPSTDTNVRVEVNYGQNSASLGMLTLALGRSTDDLKEFGGFISARQALTTQHAVYGMAGYQKVLDPEKVVPSYAYGTPPANGEAPAFSSATLSGTGPGMLHNGSVRVGYEFRPSRKLAFVLEGFLFRSHFRLQAVDVPRAEPVHTTLGLETGALLTF
ncbi:hypothetical protein [Stigmatella aurantiaca]|uniref:Conserved uncharacterized protein n=1 Tax=Stigmatella aurantiaca (strain DW4/3-1) TaxID=378806 RepID=Q094Q5_STIAD|nr:hypothetical protein [Stigmatella aurantiaca]ADO75388.1 conserved uncharacterized protein [Stigmatella aurantiaca DW4/3-1]EAU67212.1 hypothetical protein STIAU_5751 [Stigmatella aurantiaca DW4/3-1]